MFPSLYSQGEKGWRKGNKVRENKRSQASGQGLVGKAGRKDEGEASLSAGLQGSLLLLQCHSLCSRPNLSLGHCCVCVWCMVHVCVCLKLLGWVL